MLTSSGSLGSSPSKLSNSLVSSPQYQTSPFLACANQSSVSSIRSPSSVTRSWTTIHVTPSINLVSFRTSIVMDSLLPVFPRVADPQREVAVRIFVCLVIEQGRVEVRVVAILAEGLHAVRRPVRCSRQS